ncbi:MAG TPA: hypothetical protein VGF99_12660 [Myxococcota bacterium]
MSQLPFTMLLRHASRALLAVSLAAVVVVGACDCSPEEVENTDLVGDGFAAVIPVDTNTVRVRFTEDVVESSIGSAFSIADFTVLPPRDYVITPRLSAPREVTLVVDEPFAAGTRYTIEVEGLQTSTGRVVVGTVNFTALGGGGGDGTTATVRVVVADVATARRHIGGLTAQLTVGANGAFSEELQNHPLVDDGSTFSVSLPVAVDPSRTIETSDDGDASVDRRAYGVIVVDATGRLASALTRFVVPAAGDLEVAITVLPPLEIIDEPDVEPLPAPPVDDNPADGVKQVRLVVDDRAAQELSSPQVRLSFAADGTFDSSFPQTATLTPMTGDDEGYWQAVVGIKVDAARVADGSTPETFPYFGTLVEDGTAYESLSVSMVAPDETPETVRLSLGNAQWTPVTFRVDVSRAYLDPAGTQRGLRAGEAAFLTGEWQQAVDALGNNCGDAFSGGEQPCLKMRELGGHPGVWTRTIWLPPGRPYGWKVVRCVGDTGCGPLNRLVSSAGRAFATVMKNLATDNVDAFTDPAVGIVDPINPATTSAGGQTIDYSDAEVYEGTNTGGEDDPAGTPDGARMFKQEVPDLVVVVATTPIVTRVIHVGTWRDVNLGNTPQEIIDGELSVELTPTDYDDGFIGRSPPSREEP